MKSCRVVIFGAGLGGIQVWTRLAGLTAVNVVGFVDNDPAKQGSHVCGVPVRSARDLSGLDCDYVVIASVHHAQIQAQLLDAGFPAAKLVVAADADAAERLLQAVGMAAVERPISAHPAARLAIFGASTGGIRTWETLARLDGIELVAFLDNDERRRGTSLLGLPVLPPGDLDPSSVDGVVVGSVHVDAIGRQLQALGLPASRIYTPDSLVATSAAGVGTHGLTAVARPSALNYQVNDVCNARCVMCGIWKRKRGPEMSPAELAALLASPYFSDLRHVGITGGEPTLNRDLAAHYLALLDACPSLQGASFITHGLDTERALAAYVPVAKAYAARGVQFHGMVSIDGVGPVHDRVRGRVGAFERAIRTLFGLKAAGVETSACCTIVRSNVWDVWDLLEWGFGKTYIRFRVGEFINRLGNDDRVDEIRAFDSAERAHLISFFQTLILSYEPDEAVRRTYASIVSLLAGGTRRVECPFSSGAALNLDAEARFAVCAPKGTPHHLGSDPAATVAQAADERQTIRRRHCDSCIHDYHSVWRPAVAVEERRRSRVLRQLEGSEPLLPASSSTPTDPRRVVVLGWYGTETTGDLAILNGIAADYRERLQVPVQFVVPSQYPDYTRHNLARIGLDALVTSYGDDELTGGLWGAQTVIFGGGPLMDVPFLASIATVFEHARASGRRTVIEGCGVGPINLAETRTALRRLIAAADTVRLRDAASAALLRSLGLDVDAQVVEDPAVRWIRSTGIRHTGSERGPIAVFARELTHEYPQAISSAEATAALVTFLQRLCDAFPARQVELHAMHTFPVGGDDRLYARRLARTVQRVNCAADMVPRTPAETLEVMARAAFVVSMRFHSLVFAHTIGAPLLSIDYTAGGKITSFAADHGLDRCRVALSEIASVDPHRLTELGLPRETAVA